MSSEAPKLFAEVLARHGRLTRKFLTLALQINSLERLFAAARASTETSFSQGVLDELGVILSVDPAELNRIPSSGPLVVVSNHPFGLLDGLLIYDLIGRVRSDHRVLANSLMTTVPEGEGRLLPIDVFSKPGENVRSMRRVLKHLKGDGCVAVFPAGEVSYWQKSARRVTDGEWSDTAARCAMATEAAITPIFFFGQNSIAFHLAGMIDPRLRTARLPAELINKRHKKIEVRIGAPVKPCDLAQFESARQLTSYLRARTYSLGNVTRLRFAAFRSLPAMRPHQEPVAAQLSSNSIAQEIASLEAAGSIILETSDYKVFSARGDRLHAVMAEIGRLREITFRAAGEGSGKSSDVDEFDSYYHHLILWHKAQACIVGGYRLAWTDEVLSARGIAGLYTSTLFRFQPQFFERLGPAAELGRSFVRPEYQRDYAPLLVLWQAIAHVASHRPDAPVLFGPVSISATYGEAARELIVRFVSENSFRKDLAQLISPRHAFRSRLTSSEDLSTIARCLQDVEGLAAPLSDAGACSGVPVLLRQYLKLGGRVAGFNVDRKFSNALDGLLVVDLRETNPRMLARYMGREKTAEFLLQVFARRKQTA